MKTKTEIVQQLLDEKKITAEEAVILLTENIVHFPIQYNPYIYQVPLLIHPYQFPTVAQ